MKFAVLFFLLAAGFSIAEAVPNFVLIIADDVSAQDIGAFGSDVAGTPNIDSIARRGMLFEKAFLTASSCSPAAQA